jgi:hypothetical protein
MLPHMVMEPLRVHLQKVKTLHEQDLAEGSGEVYLPFAPERKYPDASGEWGWQYVLPPISGPWIRARARNADITSMRKCCSGGQKGHTRGADHEAGKLSHLSA